MTCVGVQDFQQLSDIFLYKHRGNEGIAQTPTSAYARGKFVEAFELLADSLSRLLFILAWAKHINKNIQNRIATLRRSNGIKIMNLEWWVMLCLKNSYRGKTRVFKGRWWETFTADQKKQWKRKQLVYYLLSLKINGKSVICIHIQF